MIRDLCTMEKYTDSQGNEKVSWNKIGIMFHKNDKKYVKLFHMPGVLISVFDQKQKDSEAQEEQVE